MSKSKSSSVAGAATGLLSVTCLAAQAQGLFKSFILLGAERELRCDNPADGPTPISFPGEILVANQP